MVFGVALFIGHDALEDLAEADDAHHQAGLFHHFAQQRIVHQLTGFNGSAGQAPITFERFFAPLHQQDAIPVENQRTNAQNGLGRVAPDVGLCSYSETAPLTFILARYSAFLAEMYRVIRSSSPKARLPGREPSGKLYSVCAEGETISTPLAAM